eukprot:6178222-Pleurochrysis_carterae.AAC.4
MALVRSSCIIIIALHDYLSPTVQSNCAGIGDAVQDVIYRYSCAYLAALHVPCRLKEKITTPTCSMTWQINYIASSVTDARLRFFIGSWRLKNDFHQRPVPCKERCVKGQQSDVQTNAER